MNNTLRQISGAIGAAIVITIFTAQTTNHAKTLLAAKLGSVMPIIS
ncbi:hypothetical protein ACULLL_11755 [Lysinibacillus irui]